MRTHTICFRGEIRKISTICREKKAPYQDLWKLQSDLGLHCLPVDSINNPFNILQL